jgi:hypothetical protein
MFVKINSDEYINTEEVCCIKVIDSMTCLLTTDSGIYTANMPVETFLSLAKADAGGDKELNVLQEMNKKIGELPIFAG